MFVHGALTLFILENPTAISANPEKPAENVQVHPSSSNGQSKFVKSNQFMLKDAMCNFTNGELVCHRTVGLRHISRLTGS